MLPDDMGDRDHLVDVERRLGADVDEEEIEESFEAIREGRVEFERGDVREPDEGVEVVAEDDVDVPALRPSG